MAINHFFMKLNKSHKFVFVALLVFVLDWLTKYVAASRKIDIEIIGNFLSLRYSTNTGAAFSMLQGQTVILSILSVVVMGVIVYYFKKTPAKIVPFTAMLFGGALGNFIDRAVYGYVVDFIDFSFWPAFNVADIGITIGVAGLVWLIWKEK